MNITHILNATSEIPICPDFKPYFTYKQIKIKNSLDVNVRSKLFTAVSFIYKALDSGSENIVLVHCDSGDIRSAVLIVAFLMKRKQISYQTAASILVKVRPEISINLCFKKQLIDY
jgi:protein-tyrosine phosphatase